MTLQKSSVKAPTEILQSPLRDQSANTSESQYLSFIDIQLFLLLHPCIKYKSKVFLLQTSNELIYKPPQPPASAFDLDNQNISPFTYPNKASRELFLNVWGCSSQVLQIFFCPEISSCTVLPSRACKSHKLLYNLVHGVNWTCFPAERKMTFVFISLLPYKYYLLRLSPTLILVKHPNFMWLVSHLVRLAGRLANID